MTSSRVIIVQHGDKRGRSIGYPTANLPLGNYLRPRYGIYAVTGLLPGGKVLGYAPARETQPAGHGLNS